MADVCRQGQIDQNHQTQIETGDTMSRIRVLVGTKKGAFILTADGKRKDWQISGPHFAGWEMYHLKGSPVDPNRIYASQSSGWFGETLHGPQDRRQTWEAGRDGVKDEDLPGGRQRDDGPH